jgi:hypothetical protein
LHRLIEAVLISEVSRSRLRAQTYEKAIELGVAQKIYETLAKMGTHFRMSQTEHSPLPLLATAISEGTFRVFSAEFALPAGMLEMHGIMVTHFADSFWG